jgi:ubiquinone/menaquinone biosynthesis C-methylase UbiE
MHEESSSQRLNTEAGAAVYSPVVLKLYDWWVLGLSNRFAWKCPTETVLLPFYKQYMGRKHLDVGVGTGFYPAHANRENLHQITLLDLNENSLRRAAARLKQRDVRTLKQDVMSSPFDLPDERYDSISLFYLLHCLPGTMEDKEIAIANLKRYLSRNGVLYGATILGDEAAHNPFGRLLMKTYNRKGLFSNQADTMDGLQKMLSHHFERVQVRQHNTVALFVARDLIDDGR